jgi:hypothetical protein
MGRKGSDLMGRNRSDLMGRKGSDLIGRKGSDLRNSLWLLLSGKKPYLRSRHQQPLKQAMPALKQPAAVAAELFDFYTEYH